MKAPPLNELLDVARNAVAEALIVLGSRGWMNAGLISAEGRDLKTEADLQSNEVLRKCLSPTRLTILSEEDEVIRFNPTEHPSWIIDPLDGTVNFERGFPHAAVSVGLWRGKHPLLGVVGDLHSGTVWTGIVGDISKNPTSIPAAVSNVPTADAGVLATGFPTGRDFSDHSLQNSVQFWRCFKKVRMIGSAAISLASVANGTFDAYCEEGIWWWDVAGAIPLILAGRGRLWMTPPESELKTVVFASNGRIVPPVELLQNYEDLEEYQNTG